MPLGGKFYSLFLIVFFILWWIKCSKSLQLFPLFLLFCLLFSFFFPVINSNEISYWNPTSQIAIILGDFWDKILSSKHVTKLKFSLSGCEYCQYCIFTVQCIWVFLAGDEKWCTIPCTSSPSVNRPSTNRLILNACKSNFSFEIASLSKLAAFVFKTTTSIVYMIMFPNAGVKTCDQWRHVSLARATKRTRVLDYNWS